jgi:hypothetical protein
VPPGGPFLALRPRHFFSSFSFVFARAFADASAKRFVRTTRFLLRDMLITSLGEFTK